MDQMHGKKRPIQTEALGAEARRLIDDASRAQNWKRWGPYLSERQWGTVREDYSADGSCWDYLPHEHARSRAYRWGEDGLLGICDRQCRLCFAIALWNGRDPILKERLFGLTNTQGNHGEDVKECYFYLDSTPTHSYMKALYKYPQAEFPYANLLEENARRSLEDPEFELLDTGVFEGGKYFDVFIEYAKASANDILIKTTIANRGPNAAPLHVLPTLWFRNTWSWGRTSEGYEQEPRLSLINAETVLAQHVSLGRYIFSAAPGPNGSSPLFAFTNNETNAERLFDSPNSRAHVKDAFHELIVRGRSDAINPLHEGTKVAAIYRIDIPAEREVVLRLRLRAHEEGPQVAFDDDFERVFEQRRREADEFFAENTCADLPPQQAAIARQAYAGLLWSRQFYHYVVEDWLHGDPAQPAPSSQRLHGRNSDWTHLFNRDVISMPDKWEYPWYAAWDLAFHMIPFAKIDPEFAKSQLTLMLREWYMHPNGQIPAYEF